MKLITGEAKPSTIRQTMSKELRIELKDDGRGVTLQMPKSIHNAITQERSGVLDRILEALDGQEVVLAEGFDQAVIGYDAAGGRLIYSVSGCLKILEGQGMDPQEAREYFDFNVAGAYVGPGTPVFSEDED